MDYALFCASFWDYNENFAHNHDVLLQTNHKKCDENLGQRFLKESRIPCKNSEPKEQKASVLPEVLHPPVVSQTSSLGPTTLIETAVFVSYISNTLDPRVLVGLL